MLYEYHTFVAKKEARRVPKEQIWPVHSNALELVRFTFAPCSVRSLATGLADLPNSPWILQQCSWHSRTAGTCREHPAEEALITRRGER